MIRTVLPFLGIFLISIGAVNAQNKIEAKILEKHVVYLASDELEGRGFSSKNGKKAAEYIAKQFEKYNVKPFGKTYFHTFGYRTGQINIEGNNVVGIVEGSDPVLKNEYIVIGAHYDHIGFEFDGEEKVIYNGADDNASGVATIIEMGRGLVNQKDRLKRSVILVAFDGEESGLIGSKNMVRDNYVPIEQIKAMFSIDMVGMYEENKGVEMKGIELLQDWEMFFTDIAIARKVTITKKGDKVSYRTDTKPFGDAGIPAIHVTTGTLSPYHKPEDDAHLLDYEGMETIANFLLEVSIKMAENESLLPKSKMAVKEQSKDIKPQFIEPGIRLNVGNNKHNYVDEFYKGKSVFAIETGVYATFNISSNFAIQPEVLYSTLGSDHKLGKYRTHAVSVPINLIYNIAGSNPMDMKMYVLAGGYYTYNFAGSIDKKDIDFDNTIEKEEYGINVGLLFDINKVQFGYVQKIGMTNLYQNKNIGNVVNRGSYFTLGIRF